MISLTILGDPVAKGRPRFSKYGTYNPTKTVNYETLVKEVFMFSEQLQLKGALKVEIVAEFKIPKSTSKKNKLLMLDGKLYPCKKPDLDNIAKIILDSLNSLAYVDDAQVVELSINKVYSDIPKVTIKISEVVSECLAKI